MVAKYTYVIPSAWTVATLACLVRALYNSIFTYFSSQLSVSNFTNISLSRAWE